MVFLLWIFPHRGDDSFEECLAAEVRVVEHPTVRQTFINWQRIFAIFATTRRKGKIDLDILLQAFLSDIILQLKLLGARVGNNQDNPVLRHLLQGGLQSCGDFAILLWRFLLLGRQCNGRWKLWYIVIRWDCGQIIDRVHHILSQDSWPLPFRACSLKSPPPRYVRESRLFLNSSTSLVSFSTVTAGSRNDVRTHFGIFGAFSTNIETIFLTIGRAWAIELKIVNTEIITLK